MHPAAGLISLPSSDATRRAGLYGVQREMLCEGGFAAVAVESGEGGDVGGQVLFQRWGLLTC